MHRWTRGLCQHVTARERLSQVRILHGAQLGSVRNNSTTKSEAVQSVHPHGLKQCGELLLLKIIKSNNNPGKSNILPGYFFFVNYFLLKSGWNIDGKKSDNCACPSFTLLGVRSIVFVARSNGLARCTVYAKELKFLSPCLTLRS